MERLPITHPDAARLVEEVQAEYVARYGGRDESPLEQDTFAGPRGAFFVGYLDDVPVATGAWRLREDVAFAASTSAAEIKRMYVVPSARRRGVAQRVLAHLERTAAAAGAEVVVLETGLRQPEALALYENAGYREVPGFGHYRGHALSRCFARRLGPDEPDPWDAEATCFDDEPDHGLADPATRSAWRDLLVPALPPAPARVLDLGCGTGTLTTLLAAAGFTCEGHDRSLAMVRAARAKAAAAGIEIPFRVADAAHPPGLRGSTDAVLVRHVLWALPDPVDAVRRWRRLLAEGGRVVLVEGRWHTGAGLPAAETVAILREAGLAPEVRPLPDPVLWGGPTGDERYLVTAAAGD